MTDLLLSVCVFQSLCLAYFYFFKFIYACRCAACTVATVWVLELRCRVQGTPHFFVSWVLFCVRRAADARPCIPAGCSLDAQEPVRCCSDP